MNINTHTHTHTLTRKILSALFVFVLVSISMLYFIPPAPVHAVSPSVTGLLNNSSGAFVASFTTNSFTPSSALDFLVVGVILESNNAGQITVSSITDSLSSTFTAVQNAQVNRLTGYWDNAYFYTINAPLASAQTITVTPSINAYTFVVIIEVANGTPTVICTATGSASRALGTLNPTTSTTCPVSTTQLAVGFLDTADSSVQTAGGSFTPYGYSFGSTCANGANNCPAWFQWSTTAATPTNFPATVNTATSFIEVGVTFASPSLPVQTQTIGTCTASATGGTYLTNSTQYWYAGNALGQEAVSQIQTQVENIKGSGSHTLQLLIYVTASNPAAQAPSVNYPAVLAYSKSFVITSGTTNSTITLNVNIPLNTANLSPLPFNYWAAGIVGDDHIRIHNSLVAGMVTQAGAASTLAQPTQFTGPGAATGTQLQLCATGNYQAVITGPTITITTAGTTTGSTTTTVTVSTIGANLFATSSNWPVIFLILLLPAGLFLGVTRTLAGALLGLMVGAVIGALMGILPIWAFAGIVISMVAVAFVGRDRE